MALLAFFCCRRFQQGGVLISYSQGETTHFNVLSYCSTLNIFF